MTANVVGEEGMNLNFNSLVKNEDGEEGVVDLVLTSYPVKWVEGGFESGPCNSFYRVNWKNKGPHSHQWHAQDGSESRIPDEMRAPEDWIAEGEATDIATLLQMNHTKFEQLSQKDQSTVYQASIKKKPWELGGKTGGRARFLLAEIHSTVARVVVAPCEGCEGSVISMGFHNTKLVYLAADDREIINLLPGGARLFLSSEKADLLRLTNG